MSLTRKSVSPNQHFEVKLMISDYTKGAQFSGLTFVSLDGGVPCGIGRSRPKMSQPNLKLGSAVRRLSVVQYADARVAHSKWMQRERGGRPSDRFDHLTDDDEAEASFL